ncbi:MAG TPA: hypothetical protein VJ969_01240 [Desulfopila sp.]|nr:hypothetical protein [Desulfopila sp.]
MIKIRSESLVRDDCASVIVVPEKALEEAGYIQTATDSRDASSKHEFQAMAQVAYFQYQDDEIPVTTLNAVVEIAVSENDQWLYEAALVVYRDTQGAFHILVHEGLPVKKLLEAAHRFCTRWVRLDI